MTHSKLINIKLIIIFVAFIAIVLIVAKIFTKEISLETGILGTMYTFFYGLFVSSIFKFLDEKYVNVRILLGELIGKSQSLFNVALLTKDNNLILKIKKDLTSFLRSFNELVPEKYYENQKSIDTLYGDLKGFKAKTPLNAQQYSRMIQFIDHLSITREKLEIFGKKHIKGETKFILVSTTVLYLLLIAVISLTQFNLYLNIVGVLLMFMVIFVMILMFNLDNLS